MDRTRLTAKAAMPVLEGRRVRLRPLEERDLEAVRAWRNRDDVRRWFSTTDVISPERHRVWWQRYRARDDDFVFVIEEIGERGRAARAVGTVSIYEVDRKRRRAELGRLMIGAGGAAGRGLAKEATALVVDWAFGELALEELGLEVREDNARAIAIYRGLGFVPGERREGLLLMRCRCGAPDATEERPALDERAARPTRAGRSTARRDARLR